MSGLTIFDTTVDLAQLLLPTGAIAETLPRTGQLLATTALVSGTLQLIAVPLAAGDVVSSVRVPSAAAAESPTHQWVCIVRASDLAVLGKSDDDETTAWGANTLKTFTFHAPIAIAQTAVYYLGLVVTATTPPTLRGGGGSSSSNAIASQVPRVTARSSMGLTDPASLGATAGALTDNALTFYAVLL
jgi:hypothetical protein